MFSKDIGRYFLSSGITQSLDKSSEYLDLCL